jgi:hypothetical protein
MLQMPQEIIDALGEGKINEGHTRPLLMLNDRPDEQSVLFKEIVYKKMTVREAERIARGIAKDKVRKQELLPDPEIEEIENKLQESLGTRVHIDRKEAGGKITIDFFSKEDLDSLIRALEGQGGHVMSSLVTKQSADEVSAISNNTSPDAVELDPVEAKEEMAMLDDRDIEEKKKSEQDADLYNINNFSL